MRRASRKLIDPVVNEGKAMSNWLVLVLEPVKTEKPGLNFTYPDGGDLLPVAILCGISILFTALWLLAVWEYVRLKGQTRSRKLTHVHRHV